MRKQRLYFEDVLRPLALADEAVFIGALVVGTLGIATNVLEPFYGSTCDSSSASCW